MECVEKCPLQSYVAGKAYLKGYIIINGVKILWMLVSED